MSEPKPPERPNVRIKEIPSTGLCSIAQADGVPCFELGRDCEICEHALTSWKADERTTKKDPPPEMGGDW